MTQHAHPLGDIDGTNPAAPSPVVDQPSIVDTILDLDAFLSGDVRRAETTFRFFTEPDRIANIELLQAELETLVDGSGQPLQPVGERAMGEAEGRTARVVAQELRDEQVALAKSARFIRLRAIEPADFLDWRKKWGDQLDKTMDEQPAEMWEHLVAATAVAPAVPLEKIPALRQKLGVAKYEELVFKAWRVNTTTGVSVPKSLLSSRVLQQQVPEQS